MAKRYTDFSCPTCGWGYTHHCVKGKNGSDLWMKQIPRKDWHPARHNELKRRKGTLTQKATSHGDEEGKAGSRPAEARGVHGGAERDWARRSAQGS